MDLNARLHLTLKLNMFMVKINNKGCNRRSCQCQWRSSHVIFPSSHWDLPVFPEKYAYSFDMQHPLQKCYGNLLKFRMRLNSVTRSSSVQDQEFIWWRIHGGFYYISSCYMMADPWRVLLHIVMLYDGGSMEGFTAYCHAIWWRIHGGFYCISSCYMMADPWRVLLHIVMLYDGGSMEGFTAYCHAIWWRIHGGFYCILSCYMMADPWRVLLHIVMLQNVKQYLKEGDSILFERIPFIEQ